MAHDPRCADIHLREPEPWERECTRILKEEVARG